ncbi:MAG: 16S rRNA (guanine(966)-N(2))-methyltransferase RsmD [Alphaproteobacteria bacterium]|nr:16S rRNA (guanine(966)-N(2))-methyltransferase RsmD [Alphaproteobacteria bacterium]
MRIISGQFRHRLLKRPPSDTTRPTSDRAREAVFNILIHTYGVEFQDCVVLDVFAGSGAMGFEALSRGAKQVYFVENNKQAIRCIQENSTTLGADEKVHLLRGDAPQIKKAPDGGAHVIIMDPPYNQGLILPTCAQLYKQGWINPDTLVCIESSLTDCPAHIPHLTKKEQRIYGAAAISFWVEEKET